VRFSKGQKGKLADLTPSTRVQVGVDLRATGDPVFDIACFGVDAAGQLSDDRWFVFYNQRTSPDGAISMLGAQGSDREVFAVDLGHVPPSIDKLVFTATIDGAGTMAAVTAGHLRLSVDGAEVMAFPFTGADFAQEKALILGELYRKGEWRVAAVGAGFNGGLSALLVHFGGSELDAPAPAAPVVAPPPEPVAATPVGPAPAAAPAASMPLPPPPAAPGSAWGPQPPPTGLPVQAAAPGAPPPGPPGRGPDLTKRVELDKRMEREAPQLLSLAKRAEVSLAKHQLLGHTARVALCLDVSGSMYTLYKSGKVQRLAEKVLALGTRFDDDGEIDVFAFGTNAEAMGAVGIGSFHDVAQHANGLKGPGGGTDYAKAMAVIRRHYLDHDGRRDGPVPAPLPVYVMFVTDGETGDKQAARDQVVWSAYEPIFWQFMGIGKSTRAARSGSGPMLKKQKRSLVKNLLSTDFAFLEELDELPGRYVDNANFFSVEDPEHVPDDELYELLMAEYPTWLHEATRLGLLR
jgi:stress response protein SCP2